MKYTERAKEAAAAILDAFKGGNLPAAIAPIFINRKDCSPCRSWSWANQLLVALHGHGDARGYRQWEAVGRNVKKGEKSFAILTPNVRKIKEQDDSGRESEKTIVTGFSHAAVFGLSQTDGEPLPDTDPEATRWIADLPLREVAEQWGLTVESYNGRDGGYKGYYRHRAGIAVGVRNLATWAHELVHAADDRLGNLTEQGQHWRSETVAELGGAVLLECLGEKVESDRGGCWEYVAAYATAAKVEPITACQRVLKRVCDAVALLLSTAETLKGGKCDATEPAEELKAAA